MKNLHFGASWSSTSVQLLFLKKKRTGRRAAHYIKKRRVPRQAKYKSERRKKTCTIGVSIKNVGGGDSRNCEAST
jgi:hypothetical protein